MAPISVSAPTVRYERGQTFSPLPQMRAAADRIRQELIGGSWRTR